jgi:hypothetical protein
MLWPTRQLQANLKFDMVPTAHKLSKWTSLAAVVVVIAIYAGDFVSLRVRARRATATDPFETLNAPRILAISEKGGKTEFVLDSQNPEQKITCVHSLFPHDGYSTCWQVKRTLHQPIPM